jgi:Thaumarchaeal output domain 1
MPDTILERRPLSFAVVGQTLPLGLHHGGVHLGSGADGFDGVVLAERINRDAVQRRLGSFALHWPVADLAGNAWIASDVPPGPDGGDALMALRDIAARVRTLPDYAASPDRVELELLAFMQTRAAALVPAFTPAIEETVHYPALRGRTQLRSGELRERLEALAGLDLLRRRFFARVLSCASCGSARLSAHEACTECRSSNLRDETLVHHFRCGHQAPETRFLSGNDLVCPKCRRELRHFGVDYSKPGAATSCGQCGHTMSEPHPRFSCLDCSQSFDGEHAIPVDWHAYELTAQGRDAACSGRLPHVQLAELAKPYSRAFAMRDFLVAANELLRVSRRYRRSIVFVRFQVANEAELIARLGRAGMGASYRLVVDILVENLRESDFFAATSDPGFVVALPETDKQYVATIFGRIKGRLNDAAAAPIGLHIEVRDGEGAGEMLNGLRP